MNKKSKLNTLIFHPSNENLLWHEAKYPLIWEDILMSKTSDSGGGFSYNGNLGKDAEIVFLGCSITAGSGVDKGQCWTDQISNKLKLNSHSISAPGVSVSWAINNFFSHVNYFGNPKIVLALFPDFVRMQMTSRNSEVISENDSIDDYLKEEVIRYKTSRIKEYVKNENYFKKPLVAEKIIPLEMAFDISIQYIKMLEAYCNSNNIILLWSTWFAEQEDWLDRNIKNTKFKNYISTGMKNWHSKKIDNRNEVLCQDLIDFYKNPDYEKMLPEKLESVGSSYDKTFCNPDKACNKKIDCHVEYKDERNFYRSSDSTDEIWGHPTYHRHIHIAESFIEGINEYYTRNK